MNAVAEVLTFEKYRFKCSSTCLVGYREACRHKVNGNWGTFKGLRMIDNRKKTVNWIGSYRMGEWEATGLLWVESSPKID